MLDRKRILKEPDAVKERLAMKGVESALIDRLVELDDTRRRLVNSEGAINAERKTTARTLGSLMKQGKAEDAQQVKDRALALKTELADVTASRQETDAEISRLMLELPNLPHASVPAGTGEGDNVFVRTGKLTEPPCFDFQPQTHWELGQKLGILDLAAGARISGTGFPVFKGPGARLVRALMSYMIDLHTQRHNHEEIWAPCVVNTDSMVGTAQLPKFSEDMYRLGKSNEGGEYSPDGLWLAPTAEVPLTNMLRDVNLDEKDLPIRYVAYTPCFRREAGAAGKDTRGIIRVHQFDKVEIVHFTTPEKSYEHLEEITACAEAVLDGLGLHFRVRLLCAGDMSFAGAKTYDLDVWAPGLDKYLEVSSVTNFEEFQARRIGIRYRGKDKKMHFVHTLNGSGVAFPRLIIALLETYQQAAGAFNVPRALIPYMGVDAIAPAGGSGRA